MVDHARRPQRPWRPETRNIGLNGAGQALRGRSRHRAQARGHLAGVRYPSMMTSCERTSRRGTLNTVPAAMSFSARRAPGRAAGYRATRLRRRSYAVLRRRPSRAARPTSTPDRAARIRTVTRVAWPGRSTDARETDELLSPRSRLPAGPGSAHRCRPAAPRRPPGAHVADHEAHVEAVRPRVVDSEIGILELRV